MEVAGERHSHRLSAHGMSFPSEVVDQGRWMSKAPKFLHIPEAVKFVYEREDDVGDMLLRSSNLYQVVAWTRASSAGDQ